LIQRLSEVCELTLHTHAAKQNTPCAVYRAPCALCRVPCAKNS